MPLYLGFTLAVNGNTNFFLTFVLQSSVDRMMQRGNASMMVGASSWKDQFFEAFTVQAGMFSTCTRVKDL